MKCASCQFENREGILFCEHCGMELPQASSPVVAPAFSQPVQATGLTCPTCGFLNPADMSFCTQCGSGLQSAVPVQANISCTACGAQNPVDMSFCTRCGASLRTTVPVQPNIFCTSCGASNPADFRYCEKCGNALFDVPSARPQRRTSNIGKWALAAASLAILAGIGYGLFDHFQGPLPVSPQQPVYEEVVIQDEAPPESPNTSSDPYASGNAAPPEVQGSSPVQPEPQQNPPEQPETSSEGASENPSNVQPETQPEVQPQDLPPSAWTNPEAEAYSGSPLNFPRGSAFSLTSSSRPDSDHDGLYDDVETYIAQTYTPFYIFDEAETVQRPCTGLRKVSHILNPFSNVICIELPGEVSGRTIWVYQATPGTINGHPYVLLVITTLYDIDYIEYAEGKDAILWHYGDTESLEIYIDCRDQDCNKGSYWVDQIQVNRHGHGHRYYQYELCWVDFYGQTYANCTQTQPADYGTHPAFYVSQGKHAVYGSSDECESAEVKLGILEDCNGWRFGLPDFTNLPTNVGEINYPNAQTENWVQSIFPGERVWDLDYSFCGGQPVDYQFREGGETFRLELGKTWFDEYAPNCSGSIGSKWYPFDVYATNRERPAFESSVQEIQVGFLAYADICMIKMGPPKSSNPSDGAIIATELLDGETVYYGQTKIFDFSPGFRYWFAFIGCDGTVLYEDIISCDSNCMFNVPP